MTYTARISDGGVSLEQKIEAPSIEDAVDIMERQLVATENVYAGNPDCEPRTDWNAIITDDYAECSLRGDSQDSQTWVRVTIKLVDPKPE